MGVNARDISGASQPTGGYWSVLSNNTGANFIRVESWR
jgi:hypothetical protein